MIQAHLLEPPRQLSLKAHLVPPPHQLFVAHPHHQLEQLGQLQLKWEGSGRLQLSEWRRGWRRDQALMGVGHHSHLWLSQWEEKQGLQQMTGWMQGSSVRVHTHHLHLQGVGR
mgnify:CR=1 FL=1